MTRLSAYSANVTGSDSYWFQRRNELEATFQQKKTATAFFTFSYADNHWDDLHKLMPGPPATTKAQKYQNVLNNPHLVDWFFSFKFEEFLKVVFDGILEADWRWHRYEWQSRTSIHAHGCVRLKNDPDLVRLTSLTYKGRQAEKRLLLEDDPLKQALLIDIIRIGNESEQIVCNYADTLLTTMNHRLDMLNNPQVPEPHPCSLNTHEIPI